MSIITVGIDLAKNVFAVPGVDDTGKPELDRPKVPRVGLLPLIAQFPLSDWHGSLLRRAPLGAAVPPAREHDEADRKLRCQAPVSDGSPIRLSLDIS